MKSVRYCVLLIYLFVCSASTLVEARFNNPLTRTLVPDEFMFNIPPATATVETIHYGSRHNTIVLIHDVHGNYSVQKNIAQILAYITQHYDISQCYVEGYDSLMDLSAVSSFPDKQSVEFVANKYLKNGLITGEEYFYITSPDTLAIYGLENVDTYRQHLETYRQILQTNTTVAEQLQTLRANVVSELSSDHARLVKAFNAFLGLQLTPEDFISQLKQFNLYDETRLSDYKNVSLWLKSQQISAAFDPAAFDKERFAILQQFKQALPLQLYDAIRSLAFMTDLSSFPIPKFQQVMNDLLYFSDIDITRYPNFDRYNTMIKLNTAIDLEGLYDNITAYLFSTVNARMPGLSAALKNVYEIHNLEQIIGCKLSPEKVQIFFNTLSQNHTHLYAEMSNYTAINKTEFDFHALAALLTLCNRYYSLAIQRDHIMAANFSAYTDGDNAVCIAGGFHIPGLTRLFMEKGYTVITLTPGFDGSSTDDAVYHDIIMQSKYLSAHTELSRSTLRQPAVVWRPDTLEDMKQEMLLKHLSGLTVYDLALDVLRRDIYVQSNDEESLLNQAVLYRGENDIYIDLPDLQQAIWLVYPVDKKGTPTIELVNRQTVAERIPPSAHPVDIAAHQAETFIELVGVLKQLNDAPPSHDELETLAKQRINLRDIYGLNPDSEPTLVQIQSFPPELYRAVVLYLKLKGNQDVDLSLITRLVDPENFSARFNGQEFSNILAQLFYAFFEPKKYSAYSSSIIEHLLNTDEIFTRMLLRSLAGQRNHYELHIMLFSLPDDLLVDLFDKEIIDLSDTPPASETALRDFGFIRRIFKHAEVFSIEFKQTNPAVYQMARKTDMKDISPVLKRLAPATVRNLLIQSYYYAELNTDDSSGSNLANLLYEIFNDRLLTDFLDEQNNIDRLVVLWLRETIATLHDEQETVAAQHPGFQHITDIPLSVDAIPILLDAVTAYFLELQTTDTIRNGAHLYINDINAYLNQALEEFEGTQPDAAILSWGRAADLLDLLFEANSRTASNTTAALLKTIGSKIDSIATDYITANGLQNFHLTVSGREPSVTGKLNIVPQDENSVSVINDAQQMSGSIVAVAKFPPFMESMAKPVAMISARGSEGDHADERAEKFKIPFFNIPRAHIFLAGIQPNDDGDVWLTIRQGTTRFSNELRIAAPQEIEQAKQTQIALTTPVPPSIITLPTPDLSQKQIKSLDNISLEDSRTVGPKAARIGFKKQNGIPVKQGFTLPFGFIHEFMQRAGILNTIRTELDELESDRGSDYFTAFKREALDTIREEILNAEFPPEFQNQIIQWYTDMGLDNKIVIVRSTTNAEDLPEYEGAGVYESFTSITNADELLTAIKHVAASVWSANAFDEREASGIVHTDVYPAVLVQEMVDVSYSGVMTTVNTLDGDLDKILFKIDAGAGGAVDQEAAEFLFDRQSNSLIPQQSFIPPRLRQTVVGELTDLEFDALTTAGLTVAKTFGNAPQKIEFAVDAGGVIWINQSKDARQQTSVVQLSNRQGITLDNVEHITAIAQRFAATVTLTKSSLEGNFRANTQDALQLLALDLKQGDTIMLNAVGPDAAEAMSMLSAAIIGLDTDALPFPNPSPLASDAQIRSSRILDQSL